MATENRQWILARRPAGEIKDGDLVFRTGPIPDPAKGEVVVKTEWLSLDPTNRIWMSDIPQYMPPVALGAPMRGLICGTVVKSASDSVAEGAIVMGLGTWSDYACAPAAMVSPRSGDQGHTAQGRVRPALPRGADRLFRPDGHRGAEDRRDARRLRRCRGRRQHRRPARQGARLQGCGHRGRQGEMCGADPGLRLRPRHRLQERVYRTALTRGLSRGRRHLFRQCRRRDAEHGSRPDESVRPHRPVRHDLGV